MTNKEFNFDQIEKYLSDQMKEEEKAAFENEVAINPALQEEIALHKDVLAGIDLHFEKELKQRLMSVEREFKPGKQKSTPIIPIRWLIGIAASLLLVAISFYFISNGASSPDEIYISYYEPYPNIISPAERSGEVAPAAGNALDYYEQENYPAAVEAFEADLEETLSQPALKFYYAVSLLAAGDQESAIHHLQELTESTDHSFLHQAQWYLGLAYLKAGNPEQAVQVFSDLKNTDSAYKERAETILEELE